MIEYRLTTVDNPYDPFDNFDQWIMYDNDKGYNSCSYLSRIARVTDDMSDEEVNQENSRAIDEILKYDFMNIYKKVSRERDN